MHNLQPHKYAILRQNKGPNLGDIINIGIETMQTFKVINK